MNLWVLGGACTIALVVTIYPPILVESDGHVDHVRLACLMLAMSTGFVRGVGYIPDPRYRVWRWLLSTPMAVAWLLLALWRS